MTGDWMTGDWLPGAWLTGAWLTSAWLTGDLLTSDWLTGTWLTGDWLPVTDDWCTYTSDASSIRVAATLIGRTPGSIALWAGAPINCIVIR